MSDAAMGGNGDGLDSAAETASDRTALLDRIARAGLYICAGLLVIALGVALAAPASSGFAGLILFFGLASVAGAGLYWLLKPPPAIAITPPERIPDRLSRSALEAVETPLAAVAADGTVRFSNAAYRSFVERFGFGRAAGEHVAPRITFASHPLIAPALYRLRASKGTRASEAVLFSPAPGEPPRRLVIEEKPFEAEAGEALTLWSFRDEGPGLVNTPAPQTEEDLTWIDALGLARLSLFPDGRVMAWNGVLAELYGAGLPSGKRVPELLKDFDWPDALQPPDAEMRPWGQPRAATLRSITGAELPVTVLAHHGRANSRAVHFIISTPAAAALANVAALAERPVPEQVAQGSPLALFPRLFGEAPIGTALVGADGRLVAANPALARLVGRSLEAGMSLRSLVNVSSVEGLQRLIEQTIAGRTSTSGFEVTLAGENGRITRIHAARLGKGGGVLLFVIDASEQKLLEQQVTQSQKMQAVGQLAGGIAHDFNNLLTAISGYCDLLLQSHPVGDPSFPDISQIRQTAARAANLVRQLLAFSRQQTMRPTVVRINDMIAETKVFLSRVLGERIALDVTLGRDLWPVHADPGQLERVIMNLAVNARDAMPQGGKLTIRTQNVPADAIADEAPGLDLAAKDYILIEITDTGVGIPAEHLPKIFDPFFTTKGVGEGTGLGLSTVYGIVTQSGGQVTALSEVGRGTRFRIFLPRDMHAQERIAAETEESELQQKMQDLTGKGTILIVEDEDAVRAFAVRALKARGYQVIDAENAEAALEIMRTRAPLIDLLVSDVVMPGMDGPTLAREIRAILPHMKVILISGYAEDAIRKSLETETAIEFLPKPFSLKELAAKVKETLGAEPQRTD